MRSLEPCCDSDHVLSCVNVEVNPDILLSQDNISISNVTLAFSNLIPPHARVYKTEAGDEAIISYNPRTGGIIGTLHTHDGHAFALEKCGNSYIFEEFDLESFPADEGVVDGHGVDTVELDLEERQMNIDHMRQGQKSFSVMFYYTPEFAAATPNIEDFIDQVIAETNQGYANSRIPVTVTKLCQELATVSDTSTNLLGDFSKMKGTAAALRNTADAAALLALDLPYCGVAYMATYARGNTVSVTKKSCALGYYSFGHEIGHNFGAGHNTQVVLQKAPSEGS